MTTNATYSSLRLETAEQIWCLWHARLDTSDMELEVFTALCNFATSVRCLDDLQRPTKPLSIIELYRHHCINVANYQDQPVLDGEAALRRLWRSIHWNLEPSADGGVAAISKILLSVLETVRQHDRRLLHDVDSLVAHYMQHQQPAPLAQPLTTWFRRVFSF